MSQRGNFKRVDIAHHPLDPLAKHMVEVRVMAEAEGWSMVRRKGAAPFAVRTSELRDASQPIPTAEDVRGILGPGLGVPGD